MGYKAVPISGWQLSARSASAIPIGQGMELLVPINSNVIMALGAAGLDNRLPDYFPDRIEFIDGLVYVSVGGVVTQVTTTGALPASQNGVDFTADVIVGRLSNGTEWGGSFVAPSESARIVFPGLTPAVDQFLYVWVEQSGQQVYAEFPLVPFTMLDTTHNQTASISTTTSVGSVLRVGTAILLTAAVASTTQFSAGHSLTAAISSASAASVSYPEDFRLRALPARGNLSDQNTLAFTLALAPVTGSLVLSGIPAAPAGVNQVMSYCAPVSSAGIWSAQGQPATISITSEGVVGNLGDYEYGVVGGTLPDVTMLFQMDAGYTYVLEYASVVDTWQFNTLGLMTLAENISVTDDLDYRVVTDQLVPASSVSADMSFTMAGSFNAQHGSSGAVQDNWAFQKVGDPVVQSGVTWAINLDTMASSQYTDYGFNSFFKYNGQDYGVADDGVYLLSGGSDNGTYINSVLDTGTQDFNIARNKYLPKIYLGYQSTARGLVDVIADGVKRTYETRSMANSLDVRRVDCGVGVRANYWGVTLRNYQGADFAVDSVRLTPILTLRRM